MCQKRLLMRHYCMNNSVRMVAPTSYTGTSYWTPNLLNPTFVNIQSVLPEQLITTSMGIFSLSFSFAYESRGQRKQGWQVTLSYHLPFCWGVSQKNFVWVKDAGVNTTQPHTPNNHYHTTTVVLLWEISLMYTINVMKISRMDKFIKGQQSWFMYSRVDNINTHL